VKTEDRFRLLLTATPEQLAAVDRALSTEDPNPDRTPLRLLRMGEAARETGLSRTTLWRAIGEGRLQTVEVRRGSRRIPEAELRRFVEGR